MSDQISPARPTSAASSGYFFSRPDYDSRAVQDALFHLASVDSIELCSEAKMERCRAIRDLRSCGRSVEHVLSSCGHASLCLECCERVSICPICKTLLSESGNTLRLRLYNECVEAGLITKAADNSMLEKEDGDKQLVVDIQRLYSLFDVALMNNLTSLICHYVIDVCMDETAVSSDPVYAFMLDEVVVKNWCKRTFKIIFLEVKIIYGLETTEMKARMDMLLNYSNFLGNISTVVEVLESSFRQSISAQLFDLRHLHESILKTKQHMEILIWCINHQFLENIMPCHSTMSLWSNAVSERKASSHKRCWPDPVNLPTDSKLQPGTLFIEDALMNVEVNHHDEDKNEFDLSCLAMDKGLFMRTTIDGLLACYPFINLRAAADLLFLQGSPELMLAKQAIFVYYLIDRHWGSKDDSWKYILDDLAASIGITRVSLVESLVFYLLDDHTMEALEEACALLPEISSPSTHPKVAQVLLERQVPDMALMALRWCGRDASHTLSLAEAVTAVRVRLECGLLVEAFMYQRNLCSKLETLTTTGAHTNLDWEKWMESLVSEICYLCLKRKLIDRIIELPWNLEEEKYIHKCLIAVCATDPLDTAGNLLVVYYLQRYRYAEAYQVDLKIQNLEDELLSKGRLAEGVVLRMKLISDQRTALVNRSLELLPPFQQQQIKSGPVSSELNDVANKAAEISESLSLLHPQKPQACLLLAPQEEIQIKPGLDNPINNFHGFPDMQKKANLPISSQLLPIRATPPTIKQNGYSKGRYDLRGVDHFDLPGSVSSDLNHEAYQYEIDNNQALRSDRTAAATGVARWRSDDDGDEDEWIYSDKTVKTLSVTAKGKRRSRLLTRR